MQQLNLPFVDKIMWLGEVERELARKMQNPPVRNTLIRHIEARILLGGQDPDNGYYYVWRSSLDDYIERKIKTPEQLLAA
jgi:hypothetical protein